MIKHMRSQWQAMDQRRWCIWIITITTANDHKIEFACILRNITMNPSFDRSLRFMMFTLDEPWLAIKHNTASRYGVFMCLLYRFTLSHIQHTYLYSIHCSLLLLFIFVALICVPSLDFPFVFICMSAIPPCWYRIVLNMHSVAPEIFRLRKLFHHMKTRKWIYNADFGGQWWVNIGHCCDWFMSHCTLYLISPYRNEIALGWFIFNVWP